MKKKTTKNAPKEPAQPQTQKPSEKPRHPDADWVQKTHFGYVGAYA